MAEEPGASLQSLRGLVVDGCAMEGAKLRDVGDHPLIRVFDRMSGFRLGAVPVFVRASIDDRPWQPSGVPLAVASPPPLRNDVRLSAMSLPRWVFPCAGSADAGLRWRGVRSWSGLRSAPRRRQDQALL